MLRADNGRRGRSRGLLAPDEGPVLEVIRDDDDGDIEAVAPRGEGREEEVGEAPQKKVFESMSRQKKTKNQMTHRSKREGNKSDGVTDFAVAPYYQNKAMKRPGHNSFR